MSREQLKLAQKADVTLADVRHKADAGEKPFLGLLYRERKQEEPELQIVLPSKCHVQFLNLLIQHPCRSF